MAFAVASTPRASMTGVRPGERSSLIACRTRVSTTSKTVIVPVMTTTTQMTRTTPLRPSQNLPEAARARGSGGGSPEGRRRLRTRAIAGGAGRGTGIERPGPGGACGSDAMSADAAPGTGSRPSPFVPLRRYGDPRPHTGEGRRRATSAGRCPRGAAAGAALGLWRLPGSPGAADGDDPVRLLRLPGEPDPGGGLRGGGPALGPARLGAARDRHPRGGRAGPATGRRRRRRRLPRNGDPVRPPVLPRPAGDAGGPAPGAPTDARRARGAGPGLRARGGPERLRRHHVLRRGERHRLALRPGSAGALPGVRRSARVPRPAAVPARAGAGLRAGLRRGAEHADPRGDGGGAAVR